MDDSGPYKQAYRGDDRREDYGAYEPPEPDVPPDPDQLEQTPEYRGHLIADDREDQGVDEVALAEYATEEAHGLSFRKTLDGLQQFTPSSARAQRPSNGG